MPAAIPRSAQGGEEGRLVNAAQPRCQRVHVRRAQGGGDIGRARAGLSSGSASISTGALVRR